MLRIFDLDKRTMADSRYGGKYPFGLRGGNVIAEAADASGCIKEHRLSLLITPSLSWRLAFSLGQSPSIFLRTCRQVSVDWFMRSFSLNSLIKRIKNV